MTKRSEQFIYQWRDALVLHVPELTGSACKVALVLGSYFNTRGLGAWPSQARIQRETGLSRRTVQRALDDLEARGLIERSRETRHASTRYRATVPAIVQTNLEELLADVAGASPATRGGVTSGASGGVTSDARSLPERTPTDDHGTQRAGADVVVIDFSRPTRQAAHEVRTETIMDADQKLELELREAITGAFVRNAYMAGGHLAERMTADAVELLGDTPNAVELLGDTIDDLLHGRPGLRPSNLRQWTRERIERAVADAQDAGDEPDDELPTEWPDGSQITDDDRAKAMAVARAYFQVRGKLPERREAFLFVFKWRDATGLDALVRRTLPELLERCPRAGDAALFRMIHEEAENGRRS